MCTLFLSYFSTCSSETSVAVDRYFPLLHREHHDFHHVKYVCVVGHTIVFPAKIVEIYWLGGKGYKV